MRKLGLLLAIALLISGCQTTPPLNFSVPNVGPSAVKIPAEMKSLTVSMARPDEKKGDISAGMEVALPIWKSAQEEALNKMAIFQDDAAR